MLELKLKVWSLSQQTRDGQWRAIPGEEASIYLVCIAAMKRPDGQLLVGRNIGACGSERKSLKTDRWLQLKRQTQLIGDQKLLPHAVISKSTVPFSWCCNRITPLHVGNSVNRNYATLYACIRGNKARPRIGRIEPIAHRVQTCSRCTVAQASHQIHLTTLLMARIQPEPCVVSATFTGPNLTRVCLQGMRAIKCSETGVVRAGTDQKVNNMIF
jgi:hypothetical protein